MVFRLSKQNEIKFNRGVLWLRNCGYENAASVYEKQRAGKLNVTVVNNETICNCKNCFDTNCNYISIFNHPIYNR